MEEITMAEAMIRNTRALIILGTLAFLGAVVFFLLIYYDRRERKKRGLPKKW